MNACGHLAFRDECFEDDDVICPDCGSGSKGDGYLRLALEIEAVLDVNDFTPAESAHFLPAITALKAARLRLRDGVHPTRG